VTFTTVFLIVMILYFATVLFEGFLSFRKTRDHDDYLVAGRKVGPWIAGASLGATQMSAGTFVGTIAVHYLTGASFIWAWTGIWLAYIVNALWVAPRLRRYSQEHGALTFPDYIGDRFNSHTARVVAAVLTVLAYIVFMSAQYQAGGVILQTLFGVPFVYGALLLMVITVGYTVIGGMIAVMNTDFLQQCGMAIGAVIGLPLLVSYAGGLDTIAITLRDVTPRFVSWHFGLRDLLGFGLAFGLTFVAAPYVMTRFYACRDDRTVKQAVAVALFFNVLIASSVAVIGMTMRVLYPQLSVADAASTVFANQVLPAFVGALVLTAVLAAIMSTVDSVLLVTGPALSHDIYFRTINPNASQQMRIRVDRWTMVVVGAIPLLLTIRRLDIVQFVVVAYAALLASIVFIPVVMGLFWKRATTAGAIGSMVIGFGCTLAGYLLGQPYRLNPVIYGSLAAALAMYVISLATDPVPQRNLRMFFPEIAPEGSAGAK
jgi:SSS family transporter